MRSGKNRTIFTEMLGSTYKAITYHLTSPSQVALLVLLLYNHNMFISFNGFALVRIPYLLSFS